MRLVGSLQDADDPKTVISCGQWTIFLETDPRRSCAAHKPWSAIRKVFDLSLLPRLPSDIHGRRCHYRRPSRQRNGCNLCDFDVRLTTLRLASQERKQTCCVSVVVIACEDCLKPREPLTTRQPFISVVQSFVSPPRSPDVPRWSQGRVQHHRRLVGSGAGRRIAATEWPIPDGAGRRTQVSQVVAPCAGH